MTPPQTLLQTPAAKAPARWLESTRSHSDSFLFSLAVCSLTLLILLAGSGRLVHWFVLPVWACGVLIGMDAYDWARGRMSLFDPVGIIGLLGLHFFFLAPLLHISWQFLFETPVAPVDWRADMGGMAILNLIGLVIYRWTRNVFVRRAPQTAPVQWRLNKPLFVMLTPFLLLFTGALQVWVYARFGGISGYIEAATDLTDPTRMAGMGIIFLFSETFPILALMLFAVYAKDNPRLQSWQVLVGVMVAFLVLRILFGGLRGSRSAILFALLWAGGILHFYVRPVSRQAVLFGVAFMVVFMYAYGFYKAAGAQSFQAIEDTQARAEIRESSGRDFQSVLLGDLSRADVQAYIFDRVWRPSDVTKSDYQYGWGRTYLGAIALFVPESIWPGRPLHKVKEGTEIIFGMGSYEPGETWSSKIYGLAGETMLNFGVLPVPIAFAIFGLVVSLTRRLLMILTVGDTRLLMYPYLVTFCALVLTADSDNLIVYIVQQGAFPFLLVCISSVFLKQRTVIAPLSAQAKAAF
jgi:hypothetical protein